MMDEDDGCDSCMALLVLVPSWTGECEYSHIYMIYILHLHTHIEYCTVSLHPLHSLPVFLAVCLALPCLLLLPLTHTAVLTVAGINDDILLHTSHILHSHTVTIISR